MCSTLLIILAGYGHHNDVWDKRYAMRYACGIRHMQGKRCANRDAMPMSRLWVRDMGGSTPRNERFVAR